MLPTNDNYFIDSNICLYLISEDLHKKETAKNLLLPNSSFISTQVLSENINVLLKKFKQLSIDDITKHINLLIKYNNVVTIQSTDITTAISIKTQYQLQWYDSLIIATALKAQCKILYTEDMQHNFIINNTLTIINPFIQ